MIILTAKHRFNQDHSIIELSSIFGIKNIKNISQTLWYNGKQRYAIARVNEYVFPFVNLISLAVLIFDSLYGFPLYYRNTTEESIEDDIWLSVINEFWSESIWQLLPA